MQPFNEPEWIKLVLLLADTQLWLDDMVKDALMQLNSEGRNFRDFRRIYSLSVTALAHIIERHYYKIPRHPGTGKFHIPLTEVLYYIREAAALPAMPVKGSLNLQRIINCEQIIGYDKKGLPVQTITIITDAGGRIVTAFPGVITV